MENPSARTEVEDLCRIVVVPPGVLEKGEQVAKVIPDGADSVIDRYRGYPSVCPYPSLGLPPRNLTREGYAQPTSALGSAGAGEDSMPSGRKEGKSLDSICIFLFPFLPCFLLAFLSHIFTM